MLERKRRISTWLRPITTTTLNERREAAKVVALRFDSVIPSVE
jgi:hypothetical protein